MQHGHLGFKTRSEDAPAIAYGYALSKNEAFTFTDDDSLWIVLLHITLIIDLCFL